VELLILEVEEVELQQIQEAEQEVQESLLLEHQEMQEYLYPQAQIL
jgi:hypothetical protein